MIAGAPLRAFALAAAALGTVTGAAPSAAPSPAPSPSPPATLRAYLDARSAAFDGSGIVVAYVGPEGTTITASGSSGSSAPLDDRSIFEIGSVTKTFTATLLATMVLDGSVKLDDPVVRYLPGVHVPTHAHRQITLRDLAEQRSALPRMPSNIGYDRADPYGRYTLEKMYSFLSKYQLRRDPGAQFEYSNFGVALLGQALANRARMPYGELLRRRVLDPLGMRDTTLEIRDDQRARFVPGLDPDGNPAGPWTYQAMAPAGALHATLDDLEKFADCNLGHGPLGRACLFAQQPRAPIPGGRIGLIWWTDDRDHIVHHGGDTAGYHAAMAFSPDRRRAAIVLAAGGTPVEDIAMHVLDPAIAVHLPPAPLALEPAVLDAYAGTYANDLAKLSFTVARKDDGLTVRLTGQEPSRIYPAGFDLFVSRVAHATFSFVRDPAGQPVALVLTQAGTSLTFSRPGAPTPAPSGGSAYPTVANLDAATLDSYLGEYASPLGTFYVTRSPDGLIVRLEGQGAAPVFASAKDAFYYRAIEAQLDFKRDADGYVTTLILHQNGAEVVGTRK